MSDELKIVLEDVKEKFDIVIKGFNMVKERLDRHEQSEEERFQRIEDRFDRHEVAQEERFRKIEDRLLLLQRDLNEHQENTELHQVKKKKKVY